MSTLPRHSRFARRALFIGSAALAASAMPAWAAITAPAAGTYTNAAAVTVTWDAAAAVGNTFEYQLDSGAWTAIAATSLTVADEGDHTVRVRERDSANAPVGEWSVTFTIDRTPPTTARRVLTGVGATPFNGVWWRTPVTVSYECPGDVLPSGCPATAVFDHGAAQTIPAVSVTDRAGNPFVIAAEAISIDTRPSSMFFNSDALDGPATWGWNGTALVRGSSVPKIELGTPFTFTPGCALSGDTSGLKTCTVTWNRATALVPTIGATTALGMPASVGTPVTDAVPGTRDLSQLGPRTITYTSEDLAGNLNTKTVRYEVVDTRKPSKPLLSAPLDVTTSLRPTFQWSASRDTGTGIAGYEVWIDGRVAMRVPPLTEGGIEPAEYRAALPPTAPALSESTHSWMLKTVDGAGLVTDSDVMRFRVDLTAPEPPTLAGPNGLIATRTPVYSVAGAPGATFSWTLERIVDGSSTAIESNSTSGATIAPSTLADGAYRILVRQRTSGKDSPAATIAFTVDATAPEAIRVTAGGGATGDPQPSFAWSSGEGDASYRWCVATPSGEIRLGPGTTPSTSLRLPTPLPAGNYVFKVQQVDRAGNAGPWAEVPLTIVAPPAPPLPAATQPRPSGPAAPATPSAPVAPARVAGTATSSRPAIATVLAKLSLPREGATVKQARPVLRWPRHAGATLYNVQIYRINGTKFVKVASRFPRTNQLRLPAKVIAPGQRYLWRVWPYIGARKRYTVKVKAQSWFTAAARLR